MARGFESKSVESQQIDDARNSDKKKPRDPGRSREDVDREHKMRSLEQTRRSVASDLASAKSDVHRTSLQHALEHIDGEIKKLGS